MWNPVKYWNNIDIIMYFYWGIQNNLQIILLNYPKRQVSNVTHGSLSNSLSLSPSLEYCYTHYYSFELCSLFYAQAVIFSFFGMIQYLIHAKNVKQIDSALITIPQQRVKSLQNIKIGNKIQCINYIILLQKRKNFYFNIHKNYKE